MEARQQHEQEMTSCLQCGFKIDFALQQDEFTQEAGMPSDNAAPKLGRAAVASKKSQRSASAERNDAVKPTDRSAISAAPSIASGDNRYYVITGDPIMINAAALRAPGS